MSSVAFLRTVRLRVMLAFMSLLLGLLTLEVFLRLTHVQPDSFWQLDAQVGATHIPSKKGWMIFRGGKQYVEINSLGYRDRERSVPKPHGTFRVALLGDSFVEAFQVRQDETLGAILERRLNAECGAPSTGFEVLNFGVSGFGTAEELETFRYRAVDFQPDLVILNLYTSNDLYDNSDELDVEPNRLHYVLGPHDELRRLAFSVNDNFLKRWLRAHSYAYLFVRDRIKTFTASRKAMATASSTTSAGDQAGRPRSRAALEGLQYLRAMPPAVSRAWELTAALIAQMHAEVTRRSAQFGVLVIPNREEIESRDTQSIPDSTRDYQQSLVRIDRICSQKRLECLQLADVFRGKPVDESYFPLDGHWTPKGHARAAAAAFDWMRRTRLVSCGAANQSLQAQDRPVQPPHIEGLR
jgi:hypothetical protein